MSSEKSSLKRIDIQSKTFTGKSGKKYRIELDELSVGRFMTYERKALELGFGVDFKGVFGSFAELYKVATGADKSVETPIACLHKIATIAHGQMLRLRDASVKDEFLFCTLFCNTEDEDRSTWDLASAEAKVADWAEYDARDFFFVSRLGIEGYTNALSHTETLPPLAADPPTVKKSRKS